MYCIQCLNVSLPRPKRFPTPRFNTFTIRTASCICTYFTILEVGVYSNNLLSCIGNAKLMHKVLQSTLRNPGPSAFLFHLFECALYTMYYFTHCTSPCFSKPLCLSKSWLTFSSTLTLSST